MDWIVAHRARGVQQRIALYRLSSASGPLDQSSAIAHWLCGCTDWFVARVRAVTGLQGENLREYCSGICRVVPRWFHRFFLGCTAHSRRVCHRSTGRTKGAGFHSAGQYRACCFAGAVVCWFSGECAAQSPAAGLLQGILVTLLQPRVTRHRKVSCGIRSAGDSAGRHQR